MSHTDPMILALRALGESAGTAQDDDHAQTCLHCRQELARLTEVVDLARHAGPDGHLEQPPPAVWDRIAAAVGTGAVSPATVRPLETVASSNGHQQMAGDSAERTGADGRRGIQAARRRGRLVTVLAGLAAGLIIGVGGTVGVVQLTKAPTTRVVAQIELSPLPAFPQWQGTTGTAVMRAAAGQQVMVVARSRTPRWRCRWAPANRSASSASGATGRGPAWCASPRRRWHGPGPSAPPAWTAPP